MKVHCIWLLLHFFMTATCAGPSVVREVRPSLPAPFWTLADRGAGASRTTEVKKSLEKCVAGLAEYFPRTPGALRVLTYGDRARFVKGLQQELGFAEEQSRYFLQSSAPRPLQGKMLVPPDQSPLNICHELVHHYLEHHTERRHLLQEKWFDEGTATLLSARILRPKKIRPQLGWFNMQRDYLPLYTLRGGQDWSAHHRRASSRALSYTQAMSLMEHFFRSTPDSRRSFARILQRARSISLSASFAKVTGRSVEQFFAHWLDKSRGDLEPTRFNKGARENKTGPRRGKMGPRGGKMEPRGKEEGSFLPRATPEEVGLNSEALDALLAEAIATRSDNLLVIKDGQLILERSFFGKGGPVATMSVTKSIVSLAIGLLIAEGRITSVDQPLHTWFPGWRGGDKAKITLRHILTHTAGLDHPPADGVMARHRDRTAYAQARPLKEQPGTRLSYSNEAAQLLGAVVEAAAGEPIDTFMDRRLFGPLGIKQYSWERDPAGNVLTYTGLSLRARDLARIGLLLLNHGRHQDKQLVPSTWIEQSTAPGFSFTPQMGYLWWLRQGRPGDQPKGRQTPPATEALGFNANGWQGQYLAVYPRWKLVVVRMRQPITFTEAEHERCGFHSFFKLVEALPTSPRTCE